MSFRTRRILGAALVLSLLIQMHIAENGYASRKTKIAFASARDGNLEIYVMDGDGGNQRRVTVNPARDSLPAWSPDGKKIAFESNRNNVNKDSMQIWVIDADGTNPIRLTDGWMDTYPDWSPDGKKILYDAHHGPEEHDVALAGLTVMDADGNNKRLLADGRIGVHPTWSPDGKRIACISTDRVGKVNQIYVVDVDGQNRRQLTHDFVYKRLPSWSHDGKRIAYSGDNVIWVVDSDGENQRQLTLPGWHRHPTWSPDSKTIAFQSGAGHSYSIFTVGAMVGGVKPLLEVLDQDDLDPDWFHPGGLSVTPAGSRITMWGRLKEVASRLR